MPTKIWTFNELLCGYKIEIYDTPKQISKTGAVNYIALSLAASPLYCIFSLSSKPENAFTTTIPAVPETREDFREKAIKQALIEWITKNIKSIISIYLRTISRACDGTCQNLICMGKSYERNI